MLSRQDIDLLCRVGPGTPMGSLMRQYWLPLVYSWELEPDGEPKRVRALGENLIAFRDSDGKPGFMADACPHRGASMFFGRNEERGLRCVYHGWKFDVDGVCTDMPNEPAESNFKHKIHIQTYHAADWGRVVWIYMGPGQANPPELPKWEWCTVPENQLQHQHKAIYECNFMQSLEGELDTSHVYFLHSRLDPRNTEGFGLYARDKSPKLEVVDTEYGVLYGAIRRESETTDYVRTTQFVFPCFGMFPGGGDDGTIPLSIYVPVDDNTTLHWGLRWHPSKALPGDGKPQPHEFHANGALTGGLGPLKPQQKGKAFADWRIAADQETDFMIDREAQRTKSYSGIATVRLQDYALIWSMGPIMDRTAEHLGTADAMIIRVRRRLLNAALALRDKGQAPPCADEPDRYRVRSCQANLPHNSDWKQAFADWHNARTAAHPTGGYVTVTPA